MFSPYTTATCSLILSLFCTPILSGQNQDPLPGAEFGLLLGESENELRSKLPKTVRILNREIVQVGRVAPTFRVIRYLLGTPTGRLKLEFYRDKLHHARWRPISPEETSPWVKSLGNASRTTPTSIFWIRGSRVWRASQDGRSFEAGTLEYLENAGVLSPLESRKLRERFGNIPLDTQSSPQ